MLRSTSVVMITMCALEVFMDGITLAHFRSSDATYRLFVESMHRLKQPSRAEFGLLR